MTSRRHRSIAISAAMAAALMAGACSPGDVEYNGKIFDALGATGIAGKQAGQTRMVERQGLVIPPSLDKLPPPGETAPTAQLAEVKDPDSVKRLNAAELARQQAAYCKEHYELAKLRGDSDAEQAAGPAGPCRASVLTALDKWNKGDSDAPPVDETTASIPQSTATVTSVPNSSVSVGNVTAVPAGKSR